MLESGLEVSLRWAVLTKSMGFGWKAIQALPLARSHQDGEIGSGLEKGIGANERQLSPQGHFAQQTRDCNVISVVRCDDIAIQRISLSTTYCWSSHFRKRWVSRVKSGSLRVQCQSIQSLLHNRKALSHDYQVGMVASQAQTLPGFFCNQAR
jgi:hypothetical protein